MPTQFGSLAPDLAVAVDQETPPVKTRFAVRRPMISRGYRANATMLRFMVCRRGAGFHKGGRQRSDRPPGGEHQPTSAVLATAAEKRAWIVRTAPYCESSTLLSLTIVCTCLSAPLSPESLHHAMRGFGLDLRRVAVDTVALAGLGPEKIGSVILVGGSSLMRLVTDMARDRFPEATPQRSQVFTAVVDGLALATGRDRWTGVQRREAT